MHTIAKQSSPELEREPKQVAGRKETVPTSITTSTTMMIIISTLPFPTRLISQRINICYPPLPLPLSIQLNQSDILVLIARRRNASFMRYRFPLDSVSNLFFPSSFFFQCFVFLISPFTASCHFIMAQDISHLADAVDITTYVVLVVLCSISGMGGSFYFRQKELLVFIVLFDRIMLYTIP